MACLAFRGHGVSHSGFVFLDPIMIARNRKLDASLERTVKALKKHVDKLDEAWQATPAESEEESKLESLRKPLTTYLDKHFSGWRWRY